MADADYRTKPTKDLLIVEDHDIYKKVYQAQFEHWNYTFDLVGTGKDVLVALVTTRYRLILLDVGLPDTDDRILCQRIRRDGSLGHPRRPIVMASATGQFNSRRLFASGC